MGPLTPFARSHVEVWEVPAAAHIMVRLLGRFGIRTLHLTERPKRIHYLPKNHIGVAPSIVSLVNVYAFSFLAS